MKDVNRFGYEWERHSVLLPEHEAQFKKWVMPLTPADFAGKRVLDAGCGMGRNSYWALKWGAREVVAFDADERTVKSAFKNLRQFPNARVLFKNMYDIDWRDEFDIAFSIGVIHHLGNPLAAVRKLAEAVKPGGKVAVWLYGHEGNEWIVTFVSPLRRLVTSRLPPALLYRLAYAASIPLYLFIKVVPIRSVYLSQLKGFKFRHVHLIVFDHFLPSIARYYRREEAERLLADAGLVDISLNHCNAVSWVVVGTKPTRRIRLATRGALIAPF